MRPSLSPANSIAWGARVGKALAYWLALAPERRDVSHALQALKLARVELAATRLAAKTVKDSWFLEHGLTVADWKREADLCAAELAAAQRGLQALERVGSRVLVDKLPPYLARAVLPFESAADRKATTDPTRNVITPLIAWPHRLRIVLDEEAQARADNDVKRFAQDAIDTAREAAQAAAPALGTGAIIAIAACGGLVLFVGVAAIAVAASRS